MRINKHINKRVILDYLPNGSKKIKHSLHGIITAVSKDYVMFKVIDGKEQPIKRDKIEEIKSAKT